MAVKKVLLKIRLFTNNCKLTECLFPVLIRDEINIQSLKKSLLGKQVEGFYYTEKGQEVIVFGMIEHIFCIINVEENKRKSKLPKLRGKSCLMNS